MLVNTVTPLTPYNIIYLKVNQPVMTISTNVSNGSKAVTINPFDGVGIITPAPSVKIPQGDRLYPYFLQYKKYCITGAKFTLYARPTGTGDWPDLWAVMVPVTQRPTTAVSVSDYMATPGAKLLHLNYTDATDGRKKLSLYTSYRRMYRDSSILAITASTRRDDGDLNVSATGGEVQVLIASTEPDAGVSPFRESVGMLFDLKIKYYFRFFDPVIDPRT